MPELDASPLETSVNRELAREFVTTWKSSRPDGIVVYRDLAALGRQEQWEDSPEGYPQTPPYEWWRLHDEYA